MSKKKTPKAVGPPAPPAFDLSLGYATAPLGPSSGGRSRRGLVNYDPNGAAVLSGPALTPPPRIRVQEASDGNVYAG